MPVKGSICRNVAIYTSKNVRKWPPLHIFSYIFYFFTVICYRNYTLTIKYIFVWPDKLFFKTSTEQQFSRTPWSFVFWPVQTNRLANRINNVVNQSQTWIFRYRFLYFQVRVKLAFQWYIIWPYLITLIFTLKER